MAIFGMAIPQSFWLYKIIWSDPCSDAFFKFFELSFYWIATTNALDGAAACALGYIDYRMIYGNEEDIRMAMRKKRLAFAKFAFIMAIVALFLVDKPSKNAVLPLLVGQGYTMLKYGAVIGFNLTPENFFLARNFL